MRDDLSLAFSLLFGLYAFSLIYLLANDYSMFLFITVCAQFFTILFIAIAWLESASPRKRRSRPCT